MSVSKILLAVLVGSIAIAAASSPSTPQPTSQPTPQTKSPDLVGWEYRTDEDKMNGGIRKYATIHSTNVVNFDRPYEGPQRAYIVIRRSKAGQDVMFGIQRGQFMCHVFECTITVRFDDAPPVRMTASAPADHSTTVVFISNERNFIHKLSTAKQVRVAADIYHQGTPVFEFTTAGFDATSVK